MGFLDIAILMFLERGLKLRDSKNFRKVHCTISLLLNASIFFMISLIFSSLIGNQDIGFFGVIFLFFVGLFVNALILTLQYFVILKDSKTKSDLENSNLKMENAEAAYQLLRQQIHPHFLFNALNTLKSLYKKDPIAGEKYLVHLSDFLRASLSYNDENLIQLQDELKLCNDYLEMQKIRFGEALIFNIDISEEALKKRFVPSFSIQPLLENSIKHNECTEESPLRISVKQEGEWIKVTNNLRLKTSSEKSTGSGLANLNRRYHLLSEEELIIEDNGSAFSVMLKILSYENSHH
ncbi:MAG: histidine kinase [Bacteroidales bacterium]|nr:histidine kinase [Bacteroidales bacterium]